MGKKLSRIGLFLIALLFLVTTVGFSAAVIWQAGQQDKQSQQQTDLQKALDEQQNGCAINTSPGEVMPVPEVYKPEGDVTELSIVNLKDGSGDPVKSGDCLQVKYMGSLAKDGKVFDQNFDKPVLLKFKLGGGQVIQGWDEGLVGMKVGGERRIVIPSDQAYGDKGTGSSIPPNSDLVFDVLLVKVGE
jgi:peptidylprolyl isomerase